MEYFRQRFVNELNEDGDIEVAGQKWTRHQVLETMDRAAERAVFDDWVGEQKNAAKERCRSFLEEYHCLDRFNAMMARYRKNFVVPFVGAGMSVPSGCRKWDEFLINLLNDFPDAKPEVEAQLSHDAYEEAAESVARAVGSGVFSEEITNQLGSHWENLSGPVRLLPHMFREEVFTTNFDYVLNRAYAAVEFPFVHEFKGTQLRQAAQRLSNNPHCLLRLHGEADTAEDRVLTLTEYDAVYADNAGLKGALAALIGIRSLLFLGCSLHTDRTFQALRSIREDANGEAVRHYALLPFPGQDKRAKRRAALSEAEIHPIYYPPDDHDAGIEDLLITMLEGGF